MLTFLRKIRLRLLDQAASETVRKSLFESWSARRYLLYAIGEVALVVLGILIALQINTWKKAHQDRRDELKLLADLKDEFVFNLGKARETETAIIGLTEACRTLMKLFGSRIEEVDPAYLDSLIYSSFWGPTFDSNQDIFNSIYYSGKLELLSNPKLKQMLQSWSSSIKDFEEAEANMRINLNRNVMPKLEKLVSFRNIERFGTLGGITDSKLMPDNRPVLRNLEAENILYTHLWELNHVAGLYPSLYALMEEIISELE